MNYFVHPRALCESSQIGKGTRVWAFAHIMKGVTIGKNCNICDHCFIESGVMIGNDVTVKNGVSIWEKVTIEDDVFLGPNAVFTNVLRPRSGQRGNFVETIVRKGATIGANATIVCGITIGEYAMVGAGSVVIKDVLPFTLVCGNPARQKGFVCKCGRLIIFRHRYAACNICKLRYSLSKKGVELISHD